MKINFDILLTLPPKTIENGVLKAFENSLLFKKSSEILAAEKNYAHATALLLLSIEELIKTQCLFLFSIGIRDKELINCAFVKQKNHKSVHQTRLKLAEIYTNINTLIDVEVIKNNLNLIINENPELNNLLPGENTNEYFKRVQDSIDINKLIDINAVFPKETLIEFENNNGWIANSQLLKEKCLYVDFENKKWTSPSEIDELIYLEAKAHFEKYFKTQSMIFDKFISGSKHQKINLINILQQIFNRK